jgi:ABC-2 type transport system permease protein
LPINIVYDVVPSDTRIVRDGASRPYRAISSTFSILFSDVSVSVPVKSYSYDNLTASTKDVVLFETVVVILIPLALIIIGFVIWFKRRKK